MKAIAMMPGGDSAECEMLERAQCLGRLGTIALRRAARFCTRVAIIRESGPAELCEMVWL